jgi:glyoxylase-like metal-dependent hydrolase (beta-lactamase superfamily II)
MPQRPIAPRLVSFDRRRFLALAGALVASGALPARVLAFAGPKVMTVGAVEVTVLSDGDLQVPIDVLAPDADPAALAALVAGAASGEGLVTLPATPVVLRDGSETVLVDMGTGGLFGPSSGKLLESLAAAGIDPASITKVMFTHAHGDHLFGATRDGALQLPGAAYAIGAAEWDFWMNPAIFDQLPAEMHDFARGAQANLTAIEPSVTRLKAGDTLSPGLAVIDTPGHTPGHMAIEIAGGDGALVLGDVIPSVLVHFAHPEWRFGFDTVPEQATATRRTVLDHAVAEKKLLIGYHWQDPAGHAEAADGAFRFVPA